MTTHLRLRPRGVARTAAAVMVLSVGAAALAACGGSSIPADVAARARAATELGSGNGQQAASNPTSDSGPVTPGAGPATSTPGSTDGPASPTTAGPGGSHSGGDGGGGGGGIPPAGVPGVSCAGFKNGPGITDTTIRIGNSSDISGPVPGLFTAAQQATQAYVEYFNSTGATICGRKLQLDLYDSRTDAGADQVGYAKGCENDFAMVGSMSSFDSGAPRPRRAAGSRTSARSRRPSRAGSAPPASRPARRAGRVPERRAGLHHQARRRRQERGDALHRHRCRGRERPEPGRSREGSRVRFTVEKPIDIADFNYSPYVQALKSAKVTSVQFIASSSQFARLAQAMQQSDYFPKVYLLDPSAYNDDYPKLAGTAAKGTYVFLNFTPFEEARSNREMNLYLQYLNQVAPGAKPTFFGVFAWSAARLFAEQATRLGGNLTRASLLAAMKHVDGWTGNGMHAPQHVGSKKIGDCWRFIQWTGSAWVPVDGTRYQCKGLTYASR